MKLDYEYEMLYEKIENICIENDLEFTFKYSKFPIIASIEPTEEIKNQMVMELPEVDNLVNGRIDFVFGEQLTMRILDDFSIEDKLLNRIKNQVKNLHYLHLQKFFRDMNKKLRGDVIND